MNISKLKEYMIITNAIKNYKAMCAVLDEEVKSGNAKISQIKEWERYFKWHMEGNKFIIDEIYEDVKEKMDKRKGNSGKSEGSRNSNSAEYIKSIEKLILNLLVQNTRGSIGFGRMFFAKNLLLEKLRMININYPTCKERVNKLSEYMNISKEIIEEWFETTGDLLERNLECALNNLTKQSLIIWSREITVVRIKPILNKSNNIRKNIKIDAFDEKITTYTYCPDSRTNLVHNEATDYERTFIQSTEKNILKELKVDSKQLIIRMGMWDVFKNKVDTIVLEELGIAYYYKSYKILFDEEHILQEIEDLEDTIDMFLLLDFEKENNEKLLNQSIIERNMNNIKKRQVKAQEKRNNIIGELEDNPENRKIKIRIGDTYLFDNEKLNNNLISIDAKNIKYNVKKTKVKDKESINSIDKQLDDLFGLI